MTSILDPSRGSQRSSLKVRAGRRVFSHQVGLATLVRAHRRKLVRELFQDAIGVPTERLLRLCLLLRIAVVINRGRAPKAAKLDVQTHASKSELELRMPPGFCEDQPLTVADLEREAELWAGVKYTLRVVDRPEQPDAD